MLAVALSVLFVLILLGQRASSRHAANDIRAHPSMVRTSAQDEHSRASAVIEHAPIDTPRPPVLDELSGVKGAALKRAANRSLTT